MYMWMYTLILRYCEYIWVLDISLLTQNSHDDVNDVQAFALYTSGLYLVCLKIASEYCFVGYRYLYTYDE